MDLKKLDAVEEELSRFQKALKALRKEHAAQGKANRAFNAAYPGKDESETPWHPNKYWRDTSVSAPRLTGSLKRSSMDLTRALAELRKP
jgi:hypothetical protein